MVQKFAGSRSNFQNFGCLSALHLLRTHIFNLSLLYSKTSFSNSQSTVPFNQSVTTLALFISCRVNYHLLLETESESRGGNVSTVCCQALLVLLGVSSLQRLTHILVWQKNSSRRCSVHGQITVDVRFYDPETVMSLNASSVRQRKCNRANVFAEKYFFLSEVPNSFPFFFFSMTITN